MKGHVEGPTRLFLRKQNFQSQRKAFCFENTLQKFSCQFATDWTLAGSVNNYQIMWDSVQVVSLSTVAEQVTVAKKPIDQDGIEEVGVKSMSFTFFWTGFSAGCGLIGRSGFGFECSIGGGGGEFSFRLRKSRFSTGFGGLLGMRIWFGNAEQWQPKVKCSMWITSQPNPPGQHC